MSKNFAPKESVVVRTSTENYNKYVKLQSQVDARLFYTGKVSNVSYEWQRAGSIVEVLVEDAPELVEKVSISRSCCGGANPDPHVFKIVE